jgi:hypothetical protein
MPKLVRSTLLFVGATTLLAARVYAASGSLVVVVANGPLAGTYNAPAVEITCLHEKPPNYATPGYGVSWRRFQGYGAKVLGQAAMEVSNTDKPGAKHGDVFIDFGDPDHNPVQYHIFNEPITFKLSAVGFTMDFDGKTKEGIRLHVTASCTDVTES